MGAVEEGEVNMPPVFVTHERGNKIDTFVLEADNQEYIRET